MSDKKLGRSYLIRIEKKSSFLSSITNQLSLFIEIGYPITCEFNITRNNLASANTATFTLYNLNEATRSSLVKDAWNIDDQRAVEFYAGYAEPNDLIPRCFKGTIKRAYSVRQGSDFKTVIEAFDGLISKDVPTLSFTFPKGTYKPVAIESILSEINKNSKGSTTFGQKVIGTFKRAYAMMGDPMTILQQLSEGKFYIDNGDAYILDDTEIIKGDIVELSAANGLLGTPKKMENVVECDMIFEPRIKPSQIIELKSTTAKYFKGFYKVTGIVHRGVISGNVSGDAITSLTMQLFKDTVLLYDKATNEYRVVQ